MYLKLDVVDPQMLEWGGPIGKLSKISYTSKIIENKVAWPKNLPEYQIISIRYVIISNFFRREVCIHESLFIWLWQRVIRSNEPHAELPRWNGRTQTPRLRDKCVTILKGIELRNTDVQVMLIFLGFSNQVKI